MKIEVVQKPQLGKYSDIANQVLALKDDEELRITDITKKQADAIRQYMYRFINARSRIREENGAIVLYLYKGRSK